MPDRIRFKCPACGEVKDLPETVAACPKCGQKLVTGEGYLQLYRMGSPLGVAMPYAIYIDKVGYGHLANKESTRISLPFGEHLVHVTLGMNRKCTDMTINLTPEAPIFYMKAHIKAGFIQNKIVLEAAKPEEMPPL